MVIEVVAFALLAETCVIPAASTSTSAFTAIFEARVLDTTCETSPAHSAERRYGVDGYHDKANSAAPFHLQMSSDN